MISNSQIQKIILEEIENVLMENPAVKAAMRVLRGAKSLSAYNKAVQTLKNLGVPAGRIPKWDPVTKTVRTSVAPKTSKPLAKLKDRETTMRARTAGPPKPAGAAASKPATGAAAKAADPKAAQAAVKAQLKSKQAARKARTGSGAPLDRPLARIAEREKQLKQMGAPKPGTPAWRQWVNKNPKKVAALGLGTAAALALGANYMTPDESRGGGGGGGGGEEEEKTSPDETTPDGDVSKPKPGPNVEKCKTVRGVRTLLKQKAEQATGKKGLKALLSIPLQGNDNSWIRVSYRKFFSKGKPVGRAAAEKARAEVVAQYGVELGCVEPKPGEEEGEVTKLTPDVAPGALSPGEFKLDPNLGDLNIQEPKQPQLKGMGPKFQAMLRRYKGQRQTARKAIRQRNKIIRAVLGRPLRGQETFKGFMASPVGQRMPQRRKDKINQYEEFIDRISKDTAQLGIRLVNYLKRKNPQFSKRQLDAFIKGKPMFGSGETPADLPKAGERDVAMIGRSPEERAARPSDTTSGPPPALQESKQLDRMKLLAGIKNEDK